MKASRLPLPLAAAVASAFAIPAMAPSTAFAQASNVQLYGNIIARYYATRYSGGTLSSLTGPGSYAPAQTKYGWNGGGSAWGVRGTEDLGGGLAAFFQLEASLSPDRRAAVTDSQSGEFGGQNTWVGLRGSWGEIKGGAFDTPYKAAQSFWNAGAPDQVMGVIMGNGDTTGGIPSPNCQTSLSATGIISSTATGQRFCTVTVESNATAFQRRMSNSIQYQSPSLSGFLFNFDWVINEKNEADVPASAAGVQIDASKNKASMYSTSLGWSGGPFRAGVAFENHKGFQATNTTLTERNAKDTGLMIGGQWNFGPGSVGLGWERLKYGNFSTSATPNNFQLHNWTVNGSWRVTSAGQLGASYSKTSGKTDCGVGIASCSDTGSKMWSFGYSHSMSKRTALYAVYTKIDNQAAATYYWFLGPESNSVTVGAANTVNGTIGPLQPGVDISAIQAGIRHSF